MGSGFVVPPCLHLTSPPRITSGSTSTLTKAWRGKASGCPTSLVRTGVSAARVHGPLVLGGLNTRPCLDFDQQNLLDVHSSEAEDIGNM